MKKTIVLLTAVIALALTACDSDTMPEDLLPSGTYKVADTYVDDTDQGPVWYYVGRKNGGEWQELNHASTIGLEDWGDNWQYSAKPEDEGIFYSITTWGGERDDDNETWDGIVVIESGKKGDDEKYEVGVAFKAYATATVTIPNFDVISFAFDEDEEEFTEASGKVKVKIFKGTVQQSVTEIDEGGGTVTGKNNIAVNWGDMIYIYVDPQEVETTNVVFDNLSLTYKKE
jgi:hypothetical protein